MRVSEAIQKLAGGLIVSCQASPGEPLATPAFLSALSQAVVRGGAVGIRAEHPDNLGAIRQAVPVPIIGLFKRRYPDSEIHITPTLADALAVAVTGVEIVALDATDRQRPGGESLEQVVAQLRARTSVALMADIATCEEGLRAAELGFDLVATTLSGYTAATAGRQGETEPDLDLVSALCERLHGRVPVVAEGRVSSPDQVSELFRRGAFAVVVGSAITRPTLLARRFAAATPKGVAQS